VCRLRFRSLLCAAGSPTLTDAPQKNRQAATPHRIPFLPDLILYRQAASCRRAVDPTSFDSCAILIDHHRIATPLIAPLPSAQMLFNRTLVHFRSSRAAI
jgi:hypothetical protein